MKRDIWYESKGRGKIHGCIWEPEESPKAVVQIIHGIAEHVERYDHFAAFLNSQGILAAAEDHMGHGQSGGDGAIPGHFHGGWFAAVEDSLELTNQLRRDYPGMPLIVLGHSMGSFMLRTILCRYPDAPIDGAIISGTCWQPSFAMPAVVKIMDTLCQRAGAEKPNEKLQNLVFGSYNVRVEHPRTALDWVCRDAKHPMMQGFRPTAGLLRDMMVGLAYTEKKENLSDMRKDIPVFFIAGGDDPVGSYGKGVHRAAEIFKKMGMEDVQLRLYPMCRHEILNEINRQDVYRDILNWMRKKGEISK